jgi:hypothetical protein
MPLVVSLSNHAAPRERGVTHRRWAPILRMGTRQMGLFSSLLDKRTFRACSLRLRRGI